MVYALMKLLLDLKLRCQPLVEVTISVMYDVLIFVMRAMYKVFCVDIFCICTWNAR